MTAAPPRCNKQFYLPSCLSSMIRAHTFHRFYWQLNHSGLRRKPRIEPGLLNADVSVGKWSSRDLAIRLKVERAYAGRLVRFASLQSATATITSSLISAVKLERYRV